MPSSTFQHPTGRPGLPRGRPRPIRRRRGVQRSHLHGHALPARPAAPLGAVDLRGGARGARARGGALGAQRRLGDRVHGVAHLAHRGAARHPRRHRAPPGTRRPRPPEARRPRPHPRAAPLRLVLRPRPGGEHAVRADLRRRRRVAALRRGPLPHAPRRRDHRRPLLGPRRLAASPQGAEDLGVALPGGDAIPRNSAQLCAIL